MASGDFLEKRLTIPFFTGIDQSRGIHGSDVGSSPDAQNFISRFGFLRTTYGTSVYLAALPSSCSRIFQAFFKGTTDIVSKLIAAGGGKLYAYNTTTTAWDIIGTGFTSNDWDAVSYRYETTDWIIFFNGKDSAQYWTGTGSVSPLTVTQGGDAIVVSQIVMLHERLWGAVDATNPDRIYWSESFDPTNWDLNYTLPDEGGGFLDIPTFDGSRIRSIAPALGDVLVFKDRSMHRIVGTYPGEFQLVNVYGDEGTLAHRTAIRTADKVFFLGVDGLCVYNGTSVATLASLGDRKAKGIWARVNQSYVSGACAALCDDVIYIALPLDASTANSHVVEYNIQDGTYSLVACAGITDWMMLKEGQKETLLVLVGAQMYRYDSGATILGSDIAAYWNSPEITLGTLSSRKSTGRLYMSINATSHDVGADPSIKVTFTSGDKTRTKIIPLKSGANEIRTRIKIRGRSFRFKIENQNGDAITINRGMEIAVEEDFD